MLSFQEVVSRFDKARMTGSKKAIVCCPIHGDKNPSMSITDFGDKYVFNCFSCHGGLDSKHSDKDKQRRNEITKEILEAVGLTWADIDSRPKEKKHLTWVEFVEKYASTTFKKPCKLQKRYDYITTDGEYVFSRLRFKTPDGKTFFYATFHFENDGTEKAKIGLKPKNRDDFPNAFYSPNASALKQAITDGITVFYAEGEKDVDRLCSLGFSAMTCGGSGDWNVACAEIFKDADVVICADNDEPGKKLARQVSTDLQEVARRVRIITPCENIKGGDISDFFDAGHTTEDLEKLIQSASAELPLDRFHSIGRNGAVTGVIDNAIFEYLCEVENIRIIGGTPYIYRFGYYQADENGTMLKTMIRDLIYPELRKAPKIDQIYRLFLMANELQSTPDDMNTYPAEWINFKNGFYDPVSMQMIPHNAAFRATTLIPHTFDRETIPDTSLINEWIDFICDGKDDNKQMFLQYCGYCFTHDTRQQKMMILNGDGGTGKSTILSLMEYAIGRRENISNISLEEFSQRFASYGLFGKTLNICADIKVTALDDTSTLKKILGEDTLRAEQKGKDAISFNSFAKLLFSTNQIPYVKDEKTNGFYRRLLILSVNKKPETVNTRLLDELKAHIDGFIFLCMNALEDMYANGTITESEASKEAVLALRKKSDTVMSFLSDCVETVNGNKEPRSEVYDWYTQYCYRIERTPLKKSGFFESMELKGYNCTNDRMTGGKFCIRNIKIKKDYINDL